GGDGGEGDPAVLELQPGGLLVGDHVDGDLVGQRRRGLVGGAALQGQGEARAGGACQAEGAVAGRVGQVGRRVGAGQGGGQRGQGDRRDQGREVGEGAVEADDQGGRVGGLEAGDGAG